LGQVGAARLLVGLSTHDEAQLDRALSAPIDYVAIGPVFGTASKLAPEPTIGLEAALALGARAKRARPDLPRLAIGGIDARTAPPLFAAFDLVAVIGALLPAGRRGADALHGAREVAEALARAARAPTAQPEARA
jgi:thiamine-phosphate pyrophosphorylase